MARASSCVLQMRKLGPREVKQLDELRCGGQKPTLWSDVAPDPALPG